MENKKDLVLIGIFLNNTIKRENIVECNTSYYQKGLRFKTTYSKEATVHKYHNAFAIR